ncbi:leucyl/phenylalanyl-tRNA--protein transferase [Nocardioides sp.]|uniref:leucyl/phenylalanyl-tRNA--protein transferase n=1 Tax=Nocardioides sp. TaxID=35761 RepID=UPI0035636714
MAGGRGAPIRGLCGWGVFLLGLALGRRPSERLLRLGVRRLQLRYLDWPLQRLALARLTRRSDQGWWDTLPADLSPTDQPVFFGGRDDAESAIAGFRAGFYPMPEPWAAADRRRRALLDLRGLPWHCPDPRAVTPAGQAQTNKSLRRSIRNAGWTTTMDGAFEEVLQQCVRPESDNYWITPRHQQTWRDLHHRGAAHSLEVWEGEELVGGLFGIQTGGVFYVASLFHTRSNASKVADLDLNARLAAAGGALVDAGGFWYDYFDSVGVKKISRAEFLDTLRRTRDDTVTIDVARLPVDRLAES